jgi:hypothetical protein
MDRVLCVILCIAVVVVSVIVLNYCGEPTAQATSVSVEETTQDNTQDSFLWATGMKQLEMRLIIEGAIALYEDDAEPLLGLAIRNEKYKAADAFDALGTALYSMRRHICDLQVAHRKEVMKAANADEMV